MGAKRGDPKKNAVLAWRLIFGSKFFEHQLVKDYLYSGLGGVADYLVVASSLNEIIEATKIAVTHNIPYRVIGGGSGLLLSDIGFNGLIVINRANRITCSQGSGEILAESGATTAQFVTTMAQHGFGGMEPLAHIPGSIGGAVATNVTSADWQIKQFVKLLTVLLFDNDRAVIDTVKSTDDDWHSSGREYANVTYPPVILVVRFQLSQLTTELVAKRLRFQRIINNKASLGYVFSPSLKSTDFPEELRRLILTGKIRLNREDPNLIEFRDVKSSDVRKFIDNFILIYNEHVGKLARRLHYVGYWPDEVL